MIPKLLVSVRDADEAIAACAGGADIVDVKEPQNGPLGCPSLSTLQSVCDAVRIVSCNTPVSAALGEMHEWRSNLSPEQTQLKNWLLNHPKGLRFLKLGPAGHGPDKNNPVAAKWTDAWNKVHRLFEPTVTVDAEQRPPALPVPVSDRQWIAVAYADYRRCGAPPPQAVLEAAAAAGCGGILIDTYIKDGSGLRRWCRTADLLQYRRMSQSSSMLFALAGQLSAEDLAELSSLQPDIIGIRGAACAEGNRGSVLQQQLVSRFKSAVENSFRREDLPAR